MATADQIKSLIKSYFNNNAEHFYAVALQVAAHEARKGHSALAHDIKNIIDLERKKHNQKVIPFPQEMKGLVISETSNTPISAMVTNENILKRLNRVIHEYRQQEKLKSHGMKHRRKILLVGPPGTGKTMTAKVLAKELFIPLNTIQVDRLVTKFMGETSSKLRQIFDLIEKQHGVYLFDEFDAIGGDRSIENEVGEMRRVLNSFLQFIEQDSSDSIIIAATNNPKLLDHALFRRFDDVMYYEAPDATQRKVLISNILGTFKHSKFAWKSVLKESEDLKHAEIDLACRDAIKEAILSDREKITATQLLNSLKDRKRVQESLLNEERSSTS